MMLKGLNPGISFLKKRIPYFDIHKMIRIINMTTKLSDSSLAVKLLTTNNPAQINNYTNEILNSFNKNKVTLNQAISTSVRQVQSQDYKNNNAIFIIGDFDSGYNGTVANILSNKFYVPAMVVSNMDKNIYNTKEQINNMFLYHQFDVRNFLAHQNVKVLLNLLDLLKVYLSLMVQNPIAFSLH